MKRIVYLLTFILLSFVPVSAQFESIEGIEVDLMKSHTEGELSGYNTYRVYAVMKNEGDAIMAVFGTEDMPLLVTTDGEFYQHGRGGITSRDIYRHDLIDLSEVHPLLAYDSWVTIGYEDHYENAIQAISINNDFEKTLNISDTLYTNNGFWFVFPEAEYQAKDAPAPKQCTSGPSKRILLMQLTTNGNLEGLVNVQGYTRLFDLYIEEDDSYERIKNNIQSTGLRFSAP